MLPASDLVQQNTYAASNLSLRYACCTGQPAAARIAMLRKN